MRTVEIPGGSAELREQTDLSVRQRRRVEVVAMQLGSVLEKLAAISGGRDEAAGMNMGDLDLSERQAELVFELQDATILAALASWTLDRPMPDAATISDLPGALYDALAAAAAPLVAEAVPTDFTPTIDHEDGSPTGG